MAQVTVTITIKDGVTYAPVVGATVTLPDAKNPTSVVTDATGIATFTVDVPSKNRYYTYTVAAPGYLNYKNEWLYIKTNSTIVSSTANLNRAFTLSFKVTNKSNENIKDAAVQIKQSYPAVDSTSLTGANGEVTFNSLVTIGNIIYVVSADGYADSTAQLKITKDSSAAIMIPVIKLQNAYNIDFKVTNGSNPVKGAVVTIGEDSKTTDAGGLVTFPKKVNGTYSYLITGSGFVDLTGTVTVADEDATPDVELASGFDLTFFIVNGESGEIGLKEDTVTINGITGITDDDGLLTFGVAPGSNFAFTNKKAGFKSVDVKIDNLQKDTVMQIFMIPDYKITFTVYNMGDMAALEGVKVTFAGVEAITDANGVVTYTDIVPSNTDYEYTIDAPEGTNFVAQTGTVSLPISSITYLWGSNNNIDRQIYLEEPHVTIGLGGWMPYYGAATITFDSVDYEYDQGMGSNTFYVGFGTYNYTVIPADETMAILSGSVTLDESVSTKWMQLDIVPGKNVEIYTVNSSGEPVEGSSVVLTANFNDFDGTSMSKEITTDDTGLALFNRFPLGDFYSYTYSVTNEHYKNVVDAAITITADDAFEIVTLTRGVSVIFHVENKGVALKNIPVEMNGTTVNTDAEGNAVFREVDAGSYAYNVNLAGYNGYTGEVKVSDTDVTKNVELIVTSVSDLFENSFRIYPNPTQGAVNLILPHDIKGNITVSVLNITGSVILEEYYEDVSQQIRFDISNATSGVYYVKIRGENLDSTSKIVKY